MIVPPEAYDTRTHTYVAGDQVTANDLNAVQDGVIAVSAEVDNIAAQKMEARTGSENQADSPAPTLGGAYMTWVEKVTNGTTIVVLDDFIDWRQRFVDVAGCYVSSSAYIPGGGSDDLISYDLSSAGVIRFCFTQDGHDGGLGYTPGMDIDLGTEHVRIFARSTDGALCMRKSAHAVDPDVNVVLRVIGSPQQNH